MPPLIDAIPLLNTLRDAMFLSATIGEIEEFTELGNFLKLAKAAKTS